MTKNILEGWKLYWKFVVTNPKQPKYSGQIVKLIKLEIGKRNFPPKFKMPSGKKLAEFLKINPNHVYLAYQQLKKEQILYSDSTKATYMRSPNLQSASPLNHLPFNDNATYPSEINGIHRPNVMTISAPLNEGVLKSAQYLNNHTRRQKRADAGTKGELLSPLATALLSRKNIHYSLDQMAIVPDDKAVSMVFAHLLKPGDKIVLDSSADHQLNHLIVNQLQLDLWIAPSDESGLLMGELEDYCLLNDVKVIVLRPFADLQIGEAWSADRWQRLLRMAILRKLWIVFMDDNFDHARMPGFDGILQSGVVVYVSPLNNLLQCLKQIGIVAAPSALINAIKKADEKHFYHWNARFEKAVADLYGTTFIIEDREHLKSLAKLGWDKLELLFNNYFDGMARLILSSSGNYGLIVFNDPLDAARIQEINNSSVFNRYEHVGLHPDLPVDIIRVSLYLKKWRAVEQIFKKIAFGS